MWEAPDYIVIGLATALVLALLALVGVLLWSSRRKPHYVPHTDKEWDNYWAEWRSHWADMKAQNESTKDSCKETR